MENTIGQNNAFLSLKHLVKVYPNGEKAVYDFNLDIEKNEFIVIVGPSGCGKSTTLRMIAGLEDISDGDIYLGDELLNYKPSNERKMAIVFQSYALYPQMTVYNNIAFPLTINKYPMPVVNAVLKANAEIESVLTKVAFNKFIGVLFNVFNSKGKHSEKEEQVATIFDITLEAAKILCKVFETFHEFSLEQLVNKEQEITEAIRADLKSLVEAESAKVQGRDAKYDEDFNELDENGNIKIEQRKYTPYEIKTRVYDTAEKLDLVPYLDKLPKELSGGQMQRVALGRAIIKNVPIFMMDEPLSNLDAKLRLTMRSEIVKLHNSIGATTIYVTHDQTEAMTMASRIVVMSRGFVQQIGSPEDVYNNPCNIFVAKFIGSPTMNVFSVRFDRQSKTLSNGDLVIHVEDEFIKRHDTMYEQAIEKYRALNDNFDEKAKEHILKTLSVTGEYAERQKHKQEKSSFIKKIKALFAKCKKNKETVDPYKFEREVCAQKLDELIKCANNNHELTIGIRPERIKLERKVKGKKYKNCIFVKPTVCELLGGEYNVHFTFCGKNMVGQLDAKEKITTNDEIAVNFSFDDIYVFDPITGDVI
ncbi:MAG: ABC transporter ATP-binding protein [Clostridiales bacterium]|nr:ABC transporter ATP-binding protein [Clostridiales bacterium]